MDIHGQRDNNRLLEHDYQMETIDRFGNLTQMVDSYLLEYRQLTAIQKEMQSLQMDEGEKARRLDLLQYQMDEIEQADLKPDEEEELSIRRRQLQNSQRILSSLAQARENLSGVRRENILERLYCCKMHVRAWRKRLVTFRIWQALRKNCRKWYMSCKNFPEISAMN